MISAFPNAMPVEGFMGGLLIGLAAAIMLLGLGRIAGVSGMAARATGIADSGAPRNVAIAFVMGGAMLPMAVAWVMRSRLSAPLAAPTFDLPGTTTLDRPLAIGAILFGMGWGIAGLCPGPALADLAIGPGDVAPFVVAMFVGMAAQRFIPLTSQKPKQVGPK